MGRDRETIDVYWIVKDLEGKGVIPARTSRDKAKTTKTSFNTAGPLTEIQTQYILNTSLE
jgi:hypothetical protein